MIVEVVVNTSRRTFVYRGFLIEETREGWEWTQMKANMVGKTAISPSIFEAIEAVEAWIETNE